MWWASSVVLNAFRVTASSQLDTGQPKTTCIVSAFKRLFRVTESSHVQPLVQAVSYLLGAHTFRRNWGFHQTERQVESFEHNAQQPSRQLESSHSGTRHDYAA
jgi:hypothetical protein